MAQQAPDREKALELALAQIEKNHGKGAVMRLGDEVRQPIAVIPTGSIALDVALGIGGLPRGRVVEIYGPESSGKTTLTSRPCRTSAAVVASARAKHVSYSVCVTCSELPTRPPHDVCDCRVKAPPPLEMVSAQTARLRCAGAASAV